MITYTFNMDMKTRNKKKPKQNRYSFSCTNKLPRKQRIFQIPVINQAPLMP